MKEVSVLPQNDRDARCTNAYELIIEPGRAERHYWRDLWRYRELFSVLAWRDISVRYKQTVIGAAWALIRPFLTMVVFTVIFGKLAKLPSDGTAPYALMVFAGMLPWSFFATALSDASNSLISNANLISKVYFPRLIVPMAAVVVAFVDFLISFAILMALMVWYAFVPGWQILLLPLFAALAFMASFGVGVWITALNVKYRDFRYVIPFIVQLGLYVSPVGFSSEIIPEEWRLALFAQSDGRRHRRLSLVHPWRRKPDLLAGFCAQPRRRRLFPVAWHPPVPENGKKLSPT